MTIDSFFSGLGATLVIAVIGFILSQPIFNLTLEEKALLKLNVRLLRIIFREIGIFVIITLMIFFFSDMKTGNHPTTLKFPFITNLYHPGLLIIISIIAIITFALFLLATKHSIKIRSGVKDKLRGISKKSAFSKITFSMFFIIFIYSYMVPPLYLLGYTSNIFLLSYNESYSTNITTTSEVLFQLFSFPSVAFWVFIICYLIMYIGVRWVFNLLFTALNLFSYTRVIATITLINGEKLLNRVIIRPSVDGSLLIKGYNEDASKTLLPKSSILYIDFQEKHITIHTEDEKKSSILLPPDFK